MRRAAHPLDCDCCICVDRRQLRDLDEALARDHTRHSCSTCKWCDKCDARLKVSSLTDHLTELGFIHEHIRPFAIALARECRKHEARK